MAILNQKKIGNSYKNEPVFLIKRQGLKIKKLKLNFNLT